MEKENNIILLTEQAQKLHKRGKINTKGAYCFDIKNEEKNEPIKKQIQKTNKLKVYVFDITYDVKAKNNNQKTVNDHINKTGKNILIGKNKKFIDISRLYNKKKEGIITTCLGKRFEKEKTKHKEPSTDICNIAIWCKKQNPTTKIFGTLVNVI